MTYRRILVSIFRYSPRISGDSIVERHPSSANSQHSESQEGIPMATNLTPEKITETTVATATPQTEKGSAAADSEGTSNTPAYKPSTAAPAAKVNPGNQPGANTVTPGTAKPSWTIMLYIAADALLANFAIESLKQLNN